MSSKKRFDYIGLHYDFDGPSTLLPSMGPFFHEIILKVIFYICFDIKINILILCTKGQKFIVLFRF